MRRIRHRVIIAAAAAALAAGAPAVAASSASASGGPHHQTAAARPAAGNLTAFGQPCQDNSSGKWYCMNLRGNSETEQADIQMWAAGQPENNWVEFTIGYVNNTASGGCGWPFACHSVWNTEDSGQRVVILQYQGYGAEAAGWCASQWNWSGLTDRGAILLDTCTRTANGNRDQFVNQGNYTYQAVYLSDQASGAWLGTTGLVNGQFVYGCGGPCFVHWHWLGQGKTSP